jgi:hypothetical protein
LGITSAPYCYGESKPSDDENDYHIDRIEVEEEDEEDGGDGDVELVEPINQYMTLRASKFKVVGVDDQYGCNDWVKSCRHLGLLVDKLEAERKFRDKYKCIHTAKWWHIKNSLQYKVYCSTKTYFQLQYVQELVCKWYLHGGYHQKSNS